MKISCYDPEARQRLWLSEKNGTRFFSPDEAQAKDFSNFRSHTEMMHVMQQITRDNPQYTAWEFEEDFL